MTRQPPYLDPAQPLAVRVADLISRMTAQEKLTLLPTRQQAIPRLSVPAYDIGGEGAHGLLVRRGWEQHPGGISTVFPQPIGLSCTWDKDLMRRIGSVIGDEARIYYSKDNRAHWLSLWFPTIDMERDPRWGRTEEAYGEDPYLAGKLSAALIQGAQGDDPFYVKMVCAPKHFYGNNTEKDRLSLNVEINGRVKREYYLRVFEHAFKEGKALSLMTAYNEINGIPCILNHEINHIVKGEWGCDGYIVCDGDDFKQNVTHHNCCKTYAESIALSLKAGVDAITDRDTELVISSAAEALSAGLLLEADIDRALTNTLKIRFRLGQFDPDELCPYANIPEEKLCCGKHSDIALEAAQKSVVLLQNDGILPLDPKTCGNVLLLGDLSDTNMPDWYSGKPPFSVTALESMQNLLGKDNVKHISTHDLCAIYCDRTGDADARYGDENCQPKNSSANPLSIFNANDEEAKNRAGAVGSYIRVDEGGAVYYDGDESTRTIFEEIDWGYGSVSYRSVKSGKYLNIQDDCTLACTSEAVWGWFTLELFHCDEASKRFIPHGDTLQDRFDDEQKGAIDTLMSSLKTVILTDGLSLAEDAAARADTVITVLGNHPLVNGRECFDRPGIAFPSRWTRMLNRIRAINPNIILALTAGYPYAFPKEAETIRAALYTSHGEQWAGRALADAVFGITNPAGRLSMTWYLSDDDLPDINDYDIINTPRTYMYFDKPVQYPFGHGLSYTEFAYTGLTAASCEGGYEVTCTIRNIGRLPGEDVPQLYATLNKTSVKSPVKRLCGFDRIKLQPGELKRISFTVPAEELTHWSEEENAFSITPESITFSISASSASGNHNKITVQHQ